MIYNANIRFRTNIPAEEQQALANGVVLATLAVPLYNLREH
jgi:hypothetical protein